MRIALAALLLSRPDVLLLDEPTNHLDTESMEWLETWLRGYQGAVVAVSHDRRFLDNMTERIAELTRGKLTAYPWSYERYLVEKENARERLEKEIHQQQTRMGEIERFISRFRYKSSKATQVQSRIKQLEKMEVRELEGPSKTVHFRIPEAPESGWNTLVAENLSKSYGGSRIFDAVSFSVTRGERVALVGVNGAGKSTLLRLLSGVEAPSQGTVRLGHNVKRAFYSQESAHNVNYAHTVWEEALNTSSKLTEPGKRTLLGAFLFSGEDIHKPVSVLSGGEKARLALFKLMLAESNFLILDEPTNHLDMNTKDLFQRALLQYGGTLLIVSHERHFLDQLAERVLEIRQGKLFDYPGNYSWFLEKREMTRGAEHTEGGEAGRTFKKKRDGREGAARAAKNKNALKKEVASIEAQIEKSERRREEVDLLLCAPETLSDSVLMRALVKERGELEQAVADDYAKWAEVASSLELE
jgi:ATP-binding cassette subfamily F protein 3